MGFGTNPAHIPYSGNAHDVIKGIGAVTCVYINPTIDQFWIIDYRIYDPAGDGKTKLDHVREMLNNAIAVQVPFKHSFRLSGSPSLVQPTTDPLDIAGVSVAAEKESALADQYYCVAQTSHKIP